MDPQPKRLGQQFHPQPKGQEKQNKKHDIVDIPSEDTHWPKKTIRSKVKETRSGSRSRSTN
jgi:hypothetical protein